MAVRSNPVAWAAGVVLLIASVGATARASEGIVEINQARALAGGVTPGDIPGFPVTISESGSYQLTGNLDLRTQNVNLHGIQIETGGVQLDLNGFEIVGACPCDPGGAGSGVYSFGSYVTVRNGRVRGMASYGLLLFGRGSRAERVQVIDNGGRGIELASNGEVVSCLVRGNGYAGDHAGIFTGDAAVVRENVSYGNHGDGIEIVVMLDGALVQNNYSAKNSQDGIDVSGGRATVSGNTVNKNGLWGIRVGTGGHVLDNTVLGNLYGIEIGPGGSVWRNTVRANVYRGIEAIQGSSRIEGNLVTGGYWDGINTSGGDGSAVIGNTVFAADTGLYLNPETVFGGNHVSGSGTADLGGGPGVAIECNALGGTRVCP